MELVYVMASLVKFGEDEWFEYLDEDECWTKDLQRAKVYPMDVMDEEETDRLETLHECMAWAVDRNEDGELFSRWSDTKEE